MWLLPWPIPHACNHLPICQQPYPLGSDVSQLKQELKDAIEKGELQFNSSQPIPICKKMIGRRAWPLFFSFPFLLLFFLAGYGFF